MSAESPDPPVRSSSRPNGSHAVRTLDSWKEIADFLGVSVRTAHRWADGSGMPVHHWPSGRVYAQADELDRWRHEESSGRFRRRWLPAAVMAVAGASIVAALIFAWRSYAVGVPAKVRVDGDIVVAVDAAGRRLWSASLPHIGAGEEAGWQVSSPDRSLVEDIDGDGAVEVVINALIDKPRAGTGRVVCYAQDGRVKWEFVSGRPVKSGGNEYGQSYNVHIIRAIRAGGRPYLLVVAAHRLWHPCQVVLLDPSTGRIVEEFWHPGAITHALLVDLDRDGTDELVLAGVNNPGPGIGSPVLMVLRLPFSSSPPRAGSLLAEMSSGGPMSYLVFPRSDVLTAQGGVAVFYLLATADPGTFVAHARFAGTHDPGENIASLTYQFDAGLRLLACFMTADLATRHDALWRAGRLDHPFSDQEAAWLRELHPYSSIPDGNAVQIPPLRPSR